MANSGDKWCRYRTPFGPEHKVCEAGIDFHQFESTPMHKGIREMPCLGESAEAIARCPNYSAYTEGELAEQEAEHEARWKRIGVIRKAIVAAVNETGVRSGQMACPACQTGTVGYSQAACNGHVHARCSTPDCASWME